MLTNDNDSLNENSLLNQRITALEDYCRKENVFLSQVSLNQTSKNCFHVEQELTQYIWAENVFLQCCHRLGKPFAGRNREIIVKLLHYPNLAMVLQRQKKLPRSIYINNDVSAETRRRIYTMRPLFKEAK